MNSKLLKLGEGFNEMATSSDQSSGKSIENFQVPRVKPRTTAGSGLENNITILPY